MTKFAIEDAVDYLSDEDAYEWDSGGGIMLGRIDLGEDEFPHILVSTEIETDSGQPYWNVGLYFETEKEADLRAAHDEDTLRSIVEDYKGQVPALS